MTILIGVTGNIACGKSTIINLLRDMGAETIDADKVVHQLMEPNTPGWHRIVQEFGDEILKPNGEIDRKALGAMAFRDSDVMARLEGITFPAVISTIRAAIIQSKAEVVVLEAIKLFESGLNLMCDSVWFVTCGRAQQLHRLMIDRGFPGEEAEARINSQESLRDNMKRANVVIDNSESLETTMSQVVKAWENITGHTPVHPREV